GAYASESAGTIVFPVTLSAAAALDVSVDYATADGTATAGLDYTATRGTVSFPAGTTTGQIVVPIAPDALDEPDETFTMTLTRPVNAALGTATATGTILDDDLPVLSIADAQVSEAGGTAQVTVSLAAASTKTA